MAAEERPRPILLQRNFASLFGGQLVSISGERLTYLALVGLLTEHTARFQDVGRSTFLLWLLGMVMLMPVLLFAPFTGAWVDRMNLRRVMVVSDTLRAGLVALIPLSYAATHEVACVYLLVFALFTCNVFFLPAKSAITPEIVPPSQLLLANAFLAYAGMAGTAASIGFGWVVDHLGWGPSLYINGVTYLVSVVALMLIAYRPAVHQVTVPPVTLRNYLHEVGEGWRLVRSSRYTVLALTGLAAVWVGGGFVQVAGIQHIERAAGELAGALRLGVLMCVLVVGSAVATWWLVGRGRAHPRPVLLGLGLMLAAVGLVAFAVSTRFAVFAAAALLVGLGAAPAFVLPETMLQEATEPRQRGRVFSARDFLMRLMLLAGVSVAGVATPLLGTGSALLIAAAMMAAVGLVALLAGRHVTAPEKARPAGAD